MKHRRNFAFATAFFMLLTLAFVSCSEKEPAAGNTDTATSQDTAGNHFGTEEWEW